MHTQDDDGMQVESVIHMTELRLYPNINRFCESEERGGSESWAHPMFPLHAVILKEKPAHIVRHSRPVKFFFFTPWLLR